MWCFDSSDRRDRFHANCPMTKKGAPTLIGAPPISYSPLLFPFSLAEFPLLNPCEPSHSTKSSGFRCALRHFPPAFYRVLRDDGERCTGNTHWHNNACTFCMPPSCGKGISLSYGPLPFRSSMLARTFADVNTTALVLTSAGCNSHTANACRIQRVSIQEVLSLYLNQYECSVDICYKGAMSQLARRTAGLLGLRRFDCLRCIGISISVLLRFPLEALVVTLQDAYRSHTKKAEKKCIDCRVKQVE